MYIQIAKYNPFYMFYVDDTFVIELVQRKED